MSVGKIRMLDGLVYKYSIFIPRVSRNFQMLHSRVGSRPYPQTLDQAGKVCQGQTLQLITKSRKKFYNIDSCPPLTSSLVTPILTLELLIDGSSFMLSSQPDTSQTPSWAKWNNTEYTTVHRHNYARLITDAFLGKLVQCRLKIDTYACK